MVRSIALGLSMSMFGCSLLAGLGDEPAAREDTSVADSSGEETSLADSSIDDSSVAMDADADEAEAAPEAGIDALAPIGFYNIGGGWGGFGTVDPISGNYLSTWGFTYAPSPVPFATGFDLFAGDPSAVIVHRQTGGDRPIGTLDGDGHWNWTGSAPARAMTRAVSLGPGLLASLDGATNCLTIESVTPTGATVLYQACRETALGYPSEIAGNAKGELLGYEIAGKSTRGYFDVAKKSLTHASSDAMAPGWQHVVAVGDAVLCFSKSGEPRRMAMHKLLPKNGIGAELAIGGDALLDDYTHVVALANGVLFFYRAGKDGGPTEAGRLEGTSYRRLHETSTGFSKNWDLIFGL